MQTTLDATTLVFLDESCAKTNMTRLYGRSLGGERLADHAPHGHWGTTTMIGALRLDGQTACMSVDGAMDKEVFRAYVRYVLLPLLGPGVWVVWDNLMTHADHEVRELIEATGARILFLPPYSPDLNPIEKMWSKIKAFLRGAKARVREDLNAAIRDALKTVTAEDAEGWFGACGYAASQ